MVFGGESSRMAILGILYVIVGVIGIFIGVGNLIIGERTRRLADFRLAWDMRRAREESDRGRDIIIIVCPPIATEMH